MSDYDNSDLAPEEVQETSETEEARNCNQQDYRMRPCGSTGPWRHTQQAYFVANLTTTDLEGTREQQVGKNHAARTQTIICCVGGSKPKKLERRRVDFDDEDSDDEEEQMVCSMTGQSLESLPFPVVIDSGACASVMPIGWCKHVPPQRTSQSESGEYFRAASGTKIFNEGQRCVSMMTREGAWRDVNFTVCDVAKALGSVSQMCRAGHTVVFNPPVA